MARRLLTESNAAYRGLSTKKNRVTGDMGARLAIASFWRRTAFATLIAVLPALHAHAIPTVVVAIVDTGEPEDTSVPIANPTGSAGGQFSGISFSTFQTFSNISIYAPLLVAPSDTATVRAFLTTEIGPTIDASHVVAQREFQVSTSGSTLLLEVSSLVAGRYYLTLAPGASEIGTAFQWDSVKDGSEGLITLGLSAGYSGDYNRFGMTGFDNILPPATSFTAPITNPAAYKLFTVVTDPDAVPVPEPSQVLLLLAGFAAIPFGRRAMRRAPVSPS